MLRCATVLNILANFVRLLGVLAEPYMPSFSAKLYEIMNVKYDENASKFLQVVEELRKKSEQKFLLHLLPEGQKFNEALPLFRKSNKLF